MQVVLRQAAAAGICALALFAFAAPAETPSTNSTHTLLELESPPQPGTPIQVNFAGMPASDQSWIGLYTQGARSEDPIEWHYTGKEGSGLRVFRAVPPGKYEFRPFADAHEPLGDVLAFEISSNVFSLAVVNGPVYVGYPIVVRYTGMPGNEADWIAIAPETADVRTWKQRRYTKGNKVGEVTFDGLPTGWYEIRAFEQDTQRLLGSIPYMVWDPAVNTPP